MEDGERAELLLDWLNGLPEVRMMLAAEFGGEPISENNLSRWRQGGHRDWKAHQGALERVERLVEDAEGIEGLSSGLLSDRLSVWVMSRLILAAGSLGDEGAGERDWKLLRELSRDVAQLRRGDQGAGWLRIEQERLSEEQKKKETKLEEQFWKWASVPEVRQEICRGFLTHAERLAMMRKVMFGRIEELCRQKHEPVPGERRREEGPPGVATPPLECT